VVNEWNRVDAVIFGIQFVDVHQTPSECPYTIAIWVAVAVCQSRNDGNVTQGFHHKPHCVHYTTIISDRVRGGALNGTICNVGR